LRQYRPRKANGDELEEVFNGADGKEYTKHQTMRRRYVLKPEQAKHITAGQFVKKFRLITIFIYFLLNTLFPQPDRQETQKPGSYKTTAGGRGWCPW
jgi:hypothetical protein